MTSRAPGCRFVARLVARRLSLLVMLVVCVNGAPASAQQGPRYAAAIEQELEALALEPRCESAAPDSLRCRFRGRSGLTEKGAEMVLVYSDRSDTIYIYIERFVQAQATDPATPALLMRLMEFNWELLLGKFEWNAHSGEVRLSATLSTDSNLDRRALRSAIRTLETVGARLRPQLQPAAKSR
ncbi:MAG: YbjN domain-containing protein [Myxococcales bacterium]|nr:YbjN domain-containing protein [Myxococcales bacterium]